MATVRKAVLFGSLRWIVGMFSSLHARTDLKTRVLTVFGVFVPYPGTKMADSSRIEFTSTPQFGGTTPNLLQHLDNGTSS